MDKDALETNRRNWDGRTRVHGQDRLYDSAQLVAGGSSLTDVELEGLDRAVGQVAGLDVIHLQCHIGLDSISLARLGARVTGLDFSAVALAKAAALAGQCGVEVTWVAADVCNPPASLFGCFDLVYATIGVLCWIEDIDVWMSAAHRLLRPGGTLLLVELHPFHVMIDTTDPLVFDFPYTFDGPHRLDSAGSYTDASAAIASTQTVQYAHSLGEVVTAAVGAGLVVRWLAERTDAPRDFRGGLGSPEKDGRYRLRLGSEAAPMLYTVVADRLV